jgi:hypothetical protein
VENVSDEVLIEEDEEFDEEEEKKKDPKSCWERVSETVTSKYLVYLAFRPKLLYLKFKPKYLVYLIFKSKLPFVYEI